MVLTWQLMFLSVPPTSFFSFLCFCFPCCVSSLYLPPLTENELCGQRRISQGGAAVYQVHSGNLKTDPVPTSTSWQVTGVCELWDGHERLLVESWLQTQAENKTKNIIKCKIVSIAMSALPKKLKKQPEQLRVRFCRDFSSC